MKVRRVRRIRGGYHAEIVPHDSIVIGAKGSDPVTALERAASIADKLASDPALAAIIPPQARAGLVALKLASKAIKSGDIESFLSKQAPKAASAVVSVLRRIL